MELLDVSVLDGRGLITIAICDIKDRLRLKDYFIEAEKQFNARDLLQVEFFYLKGDPAFICRVNGRATVGVLSDIEAEMNNEMIDRNFPNGDGLYLFEAELSAAQYDEYGRMELPAYWELELMDFREHSSDVA